MFPSTNNTIKNMAFEHYLYNSFYLVFLHDDIKNIYNQNKRDYLPYNYIQANKLEFHLIPKRKKFMSLGSCRQRSWRWWRGWRGGG